MAKRKKPPEKGKGAAKQPAKKQAKGGKKQAKSKVPSTQDILAAARKETAAASDVAPADATKAGVCTGQKASDATIMKERDSYMTYAETRGSTDGIIHPALICSWVHDIVAKRKVVGSTMLKHFDHLLFAYRAQWSADGGALKMKDLGYVPPTSLLRSDSYWHSVYELRRRRSPPRRSEWLEN